MLCVTSATSRAPVRARIASIFAASCPAKRSIDASGGPYEIAWSGPAPAAASRRRIDVHTPALHSTPWTRSTGAGDRVAGSSGTSSR